MPTTTATTTTRVRQVTCQDHQPSHRHTLHGWAVRDGWNATVLQQAAYSEFTYTSDEAKGYAEEALQEYVAHGYTRDRLMVVRVHLCCDNYMGWQVCGTGRSS